MAGRFVRPLGFVSEISESSEEERDQTEREEEMPNVISTKINPLAVIDQFPQDPTFNEARVFWHDWSRLMKKTFSVSQRNTLTDEAKLQILLYKGGDYIRKIVAESIEDLTLDGAFELVDDHFKLNSNPLADAAAFSRLKQGDDSFTRFTDSVRKKARVFGVLDEKRVIAQIVVGARETEKLSDFTIRGEVKLSEVIAYGHQLEEQAATRETKFIPKEVNTIREKFNQSRFKPYEAKKFNQSSGSKQMRSNNNGDCYFCGYKHEKGKCPAYNKKCTNCGKLNHFAKVCRGMKKDVKEEVNQAEVVEE